jgi:Protein of unknown function (DUF3175)
MVAGQSRRKRATGASAKHPSRSRASDSTRSAKASSEKRPGRWSHQVMEHSDALDLERDVFKQDDPDRIAASLKASALASRRRKGTPFQSAMSMLNFYINRAGRNLSKSRRATLELAKRKLRKAFGRTP